MMKYHDFINFGIILKPKNKIKYARVYKSAKEEEKETIGRD